MPGTSAPVEVQRPCPVCGGVRARLLCAQMLARFEDSPLSGDQRIVWCEICGMVYADTAQTQRQYDEYYRHCSKYDDQRTGGAGAESGWEALRVGAIAANVQRWFPDPAARLLDAGSGRGDVLALLQKAGYTNLAALDPSPGSVRRIARDLGIEARTGSLHDPGFPPGSFDGVILAGVLEHVLDLTTALRRLGALLRPGGRLYIEVPDAMRYIEQLASPFQDFNLEHLNHFTLISLPQLLSANGFTCLAAEAKPAVGKFSSEVREITGLFVPGPRPATPPPLRRDDEILPCLETYVARSRESFDRLDAWLSTTLAEHPRLLAWGTGQFALKLLGMTRLREAGIVAFADGNPVHHGRRIAGAPVVPPEEIGRWPYPILITSILHAPEIEDRIRNQLRLPNPILVLPDPATEAGRRRLGLKGVIPPGLKRYDETKRLRILADCLPLATPFTVGIDPCNVCNFQCRFCPTGHPQLLRQVNRPTGRMPLELFRKIIDDLKEFPDKVKRLYLYHEGEPLLNPQLPEMIAYARQAGVAESIQTTTNGALLTRGLARALIEAGLDLIRISVEHVTDEGYRELTRTFADYDLVRRNVEMLFEERNRAGSRLQIHPKIMDVGLTSEQLEKFRRDFQPISDLLNIQQLTGMPNAHLFDFTLGTHPTEGSEGAPLKPDRLVCAQPFYVMLVKFAGVTVACSEDWTWEAVTGDVTRQSMSEIWNGERLRQFRLMQLRGERHTVNCCRGCPFVQGLPMENDLDASRDRLLERYGPASPAGAPGGSQP